jgi:PAS domain S-box-containing protein
VRPSRVGIEEEAHFPAWAESIPELVWISTPSGRLSYLNERWTTYTGLPYEQLQHRFTELVLHADDVAPMWHAWEAAIASLRPYEIEYRLRAADGSYRWFKAHAAPVYTPDGTCREWIGTATDIDDQRRTADNLRFVLDCANTLASAADVPSVCANLARLATDRFADWCIVALDDGEGRYTAPAIAHRDPDRLRFVESYRDRNPVRSNTGISRVIETNEPILMPTVDPADVEAAAIDDEHREVLASLRMSSAMIVPIAPPNGAAIGALAVFSSNSARRFDEAALSVAQSVARQAGIAILRARALANERHTSALLRFLAKAARHLSETFDVGTAIASVLDLSTRHLADFAYVWNVTNGALRVAAAAARHDIHAEALQRIVGERPLRPAAEAIVLEALRGGVPYTPEHLQRGTISREMIYDYAFEPFSMLSESTLLAVPIRLHGEPAGALVFGRAGNDRPFTSIEREILSDLSRHVALAYAQAELFERERRISTELQRAMLPRIEMLPNVPGIRFDVVYRPSSQGSAIGGDWYDAFTLPDGTIVISVGDVTGRGLGAAGLMGKLRQALGVVPLYERDPARMLDAVDLLLRQRGSTAIATAFMALIDPSHRTITFANAGHPYPLLRRGNDVVELAAHGLPLGLRDHARGESVTMPLGDARLLVLFTDGLTEATRDVVAGERRLHGVVESDAVLYVKSPARMICDACLPEASLDDAAVLVLQFTEHPQWTFDAENARAAHDARADFVAYLTHNGAIGDLAGAEIIFGELIGNVVRHAPGPIEVQLEWSGAQPALHVTDRGPGFDRAPALPDDVLKESGRGLFIVDALGGGLRVEHVPGYGTHIATPLPVHRS